MVGQPDIDPLTRGFRLGQFGSADKAVAAYLANRRAPYPLETFHDGDEVDANDYAPGTIFYGNREKLSVDGVLRATYDDTETPAQIEHPDDTGFELLDYTEDFRSDRSAGFSRRHFIEADNIRYAAMRSFMVVTGGRGARNNLQPVNEYALYRMPDGTIANVLASAPMDTPIKVGVTTHTKIGSHEQLHRVNTLMLSSEAQTTRKLSFAERLGSIGLNPFAHRS